MKIAPLALTLGALICAGAANAAEPAFDAFRAVCLDPAADFTAVTAAAAAGKWGASDAAPDAAMASVAVTQSTTRATTVGGTLGLTLSAWTGATKTGVTVRDCTVHVQKSMLTALTGAASGWTGIQPSEQNDKRATWRFSLTGGAAKALTPADYDKAAATSGLSILTVSADADGSVLDLMVIKK